MSSSPVKTLVILFASSAIDHQPPGKPLIDLILYDKSSIGQLARVFDLWALVDVVTCSERSKNLEGS
jgi:hypothetical protein